MNTKALRQKVLDLAIHGKLVPQNPNDESADVLLKKIREEKAEKIKKGELKADKKDSFIFVGSDKRHYEQFSDGTVKDIEDEIPFEVPEGWAWCRLGQLTKIQSSKRVFEKDYVSSGIPFYRSKEIGILSRNEIIRDCLYISKDHYENLKSQYGVPKTGDILITSVGSIGNTWICDEREFYYKDGNLTQIVKNDFFDSYYMNFFLKSNIFSNQVFDTAAGSAYNALTIEKLNKILFPLPPIDEQKVIISNIRSIFAEIDYLDENKLDLQTAIKQAKSKILDLAIHGKLVKQDQSDEPAEELLKRIATSDNRPYKKIENEPFEIPSSWCWCYLPDLCRKPITDGTHNSPPNSNKGDFIYITAKNIKNYKICLDDISYVKKEVHEAIYNRCSPELNDVLLTKDGTIGEVAVNHLHFPFSMLSSVALIKPDKTLLSWYLAYSLKSDYLQSQMKKKAKGSALKRIILGQINDFLIPLPPLTEQQRIITKIEELYIQLDIISEQLS